MYSCLNLTKKEGPTSTSPRIIFSKVDKVFFFFFFNYNLFWKRKIVDKVLKVTDVGTFPQVTSTYNKVRFYLFIFVWIISYFNLHFWNNLKCWKLTLIYIHMLKLKEKQLSFWNDINSDLDPNLTKNTHHKRIRINIFTLIELK